MLDICKFLFDQPLCLKLKFFKSNQINILSILVYCDKFLYFSPEREKVIHSLKHLSGAI